MMSGGSSTARPPPTVVPNIRCNGRAHVGEAAGKRSMVHDEVANVLDK